MNTITPSHKPMLEPLAIGIIIQIIKLSLIGLIAPLLFSCSKQLTRDEAANAIRQKYNLPYNEFREVQFTQTQSVRFDIPFRYYPEYKEVT